MTQSTVSFIDQLESAAAGVEINLVPVEEIIEVVEEKIVKEEPVEEKKELFTGSVENAMEELSTLFEVPLQFLFLRKNLKKRLFQYHNLWLKSLVEVRKRLKL